MRIKKGFITEKTNLLKKIMFMPVFAEEPQGTEPTNPQGGQEPTEPQNQPSANTVNFEDLIAKARQQEKAKLYPQIQKLQEQIIYQGGGFLQTSIIGHTPMYRKIKYLIGINVHCLVRYGTLFERVFAKI